MADTLAPTGLQPDTLGQPPLAELVAVLTAVSHGQPRVLTIQGGRALPAGPFQMVHSSLQSGLRAWVQTQTGHSLGYVEQLYTFAERERQGINGPVLAVSYLGLTLEQPAAPCTTALADASTEHPTAHVLASGWRDWYSYFPWEDWRDGRPALLTDRIGPQLLRWAHEASDSAAVQHRLARVSSHFALHGQPWNEEMVLQRYELLFEAALVPEAAPCVGALRGSLPGQSMLRDHRRILATGMTRLRAKIKYRPVVFELMPPTFTLLQLQQTVEALAGRGLHKQNFRRLIAQQSLVEETGELATGSAGRPAMLYRFRSGVLQERSIVGSRLPLAREADAVQVGLYSNTA